MRGENPMRNEPLTLMKPYQRLTPMALLATASLACLTWACAARAQDAPTQRARGLAASCASCHGTDGRTVEGAAAPALAGLPATYMVEQMKAFKAGTRTATVMHQIAKGFDDAQVAQLASYFASQKK
jgi:sulfide dehydrogenase cytochrome subunit